MIGCGRIGFLLEKDPLRQKPCTHYGGARAAGSPVSHCCDINQERLDLFGNEARIPPANRFRDYRELLQKARPELVIVATWTGSHDAVSVEAARCGARVIVLEKPMAPDLARCRTIIRECEDRGAAIIINHERRYDNRYRKVKELLGGSAIGMIKTVHASILTSGAGPSSNEEGGGPLLHDGTHLVDMIRYLFGEITKVEGVFYREGRTHGYEDRALAWLATEQGVEVFLEAGGSRNYFVFELEISGTAGKIVIGNGYEKLFMGRRSRLYTGFRDIEEVPFPPYLKNSCFCDLYLEAKRALKGKAPIVSSGMDGYKALEVVHAIYHSAHKRRKMISLPVDPRQINIRKIFGLRQKAFDMG
jgi:predicted dehydrogenase